MMKCVLHSSAYDKGYHYPIICVVEKINIIEQGYQKNNIIDACNQVREQIRYPIGLHAANEIYGKIRVRYSSSRGQVIYQHDSLPLGTDESITKDVNRFLLVCLGGENETRKYNQDSCLSVIREVRKSCPEIYCQFLAVFKV